MRVYELTQEQFLPITPIQAWDFFSNPKNLNEITPDSMGFQITSNPDEEMYNGQIITYKIKILPGIKSTWVTEIKAVDTLKSFIDEQRFGPYKFWHHKHTFHEVDGGVKMTDKIYYALPFGLLGRIVHYLFVRNKLHQIFSYRYKWLNGYFNK